MDGIILRSDPAALLGRVRQRVAEELAPIAPRIDHEGFYPAEALRSLGEAGAFDAHLSATPRFGAAIDAMATISEACMSAGFCTWCQDALGWYLHNTDNTALRERVQPDVASGAALGGTGLSNPLKSLAGIENFKLRGRRVAGGYEVSGVLPWVSNLGDGHWFGTIFAVEQGSTEDPAHRAMALVRCGQPGVEIRQNAHFIALEGTGTYSVLFRRALIADEQMLADPLGDMVARIRPGFILLQTGMGLGVTDACIGLMREANVHLGHSNRYLPRGPDAFADDLQAVRDEIGHLSRTAEDPSPGFLREVLRARLRCSELTLAAGQAALLHAGSRGYLEGSAVNRRIREGYFVAIITPSIRHLHQEIARLESVH